MNYKTELKQLEIQKQKFEIQHKSNIIDLRKKYIPEYNSNRFWETGWKCEKSPIGICLWDSEKDSDDFEQCCTFCGKPEERK